MKKIEKIIYDKDDCECHECKNNKTFADKINEIIDVLNQKENNTMISVQPIGYMPNQVSSGELCKICGAWKSYGQDNNHHCTGYKVTC